MNIQKIFNAQLYTMPLIKNQSSKTYQKTNFGLKMPTPIGADTISFTARGTKVLPQEIRAAIARKEARALRDARQIAEAKKDATKTKPTKKNLSGEERTWGVSLDTARTIHNMIIKPQEQIDKFFNKIFGDLLVSEINPDNLLLSTSGRAKSDISIMEKSATLKLNSIQEILDNLTDLNGRKTVMNFKTGKLESEMVLSRYIPLIKTGQIRLKEIELQRPKAIEHLSAKEKEEFDYVSKEFLDKLEDAQEEVLNGLEDDVNKIILIDRPLPKYTKGNYCALHLLLELTEEGARPFEHQHMGAREAKGKIFDDKRFKHFDGKQLDKAYNPLTELWESLMTQENAKERFLLYCRDAIFQLREDELHEYKTQKLVNKPTGFFKSVQKYMLPPEYDLNYQYKIMLKCDKEAAKKVNKKTVSTNTPKQVVIITEKNINPDKQKKNKQTKNNKSLKTIYYTQ